MSRSTEPLDDRVVLDASTSHLHIDIYSLCSSDILRPSAVSVALPEACAEASRQGNQRFRQFGFDLKGQTCEQP